MCDERDRGRDRTESVGVQLLATESWQSLAHSTVDQKRVPFTGPGIFSHSALGQIPNVVALK